MESRAFLILRYLINTIIILGVVFDSNPLQLYTVILVLLFIVNTQVRYFLLRGKIAPIFISIILDFILGYALHLNTPLILFPCLILAIVDSSLLIDNWSSYFFSFVAILIFIYEWRNIEESLYYIAGIISIGLLSLVVKKEQCKIVKIEEFYHRLRRFEEELVKTNNELEAYANSIKEISILQERNRISREIHDSVGHSLSTIIIQLGAIEKIATSDGESAALMASNLRDFSKSGLEEIRKALRELKPKEFAEYEFLFQIQTLIKEFSKLTSIDVKLGFSKSKWELDENTSLVLYRAVQEFLSNSSRHGKATKINIFLHFNTDELIITMKDNGMGIKKILPGLGLTSLEERVREINGKLNYESEEGKGFFLRIILELN